MTVWLSTLSKMSFKEEAVKYFSRTALNASPRERPSGVSYVMSASNAEYSLAESHRQHLDPWIREMTRSTDYHQWISEMAQNITLRGRTLLVWTTRSSQQSVAADDRALRRSQFQTTAGSDQVTASSDLFGLTYIRGCWHWTISVTGTRGCGEFVPLSVWFFYAAPFIKCSYLGLQEVAKGRRATQRSSKTMSMRQWWWWWYIDEHFLVCGATGRRTGRWLPGTELTTSRHTPASSDMFVNYNSITIFLTTREVARYRPI